MASSREIRVYETVSVAYTCPHAFSPSDPYFGGAIRATDHLLIDLLWWERRSKYPGGGEIPSRSVRPEIP